MADRSSGPAIIIAALILGASLVASALLVQTSLDNATAELAKVVVAIEEAPARPSAPAAAPSRPARPDPNRRYSINVKGSPIKGSADAKIKVVEFSDFQCPFCARVGPTLEKIAKEYPDDVQIAFKHLPLSIHPKAPAAHAAAEAAHKQGRFWEMHDKIFANQRSMSPAAYEQYAKEIGLDVGRFKKDVASTDVKKRVDGDAAEAARLGVTGTPAFFINGRYLSGAQPFESFKRIIDQELEKG
ncbi:MAG: thioredoxin domain-containing protein [Myxococcota bacterium]|nr:thioredoxin domain-containing protein [Myxococcota bacterium]